MPNKKNGLAPGDAICRRVGLLMADLECGRGGERRSRQSRIPECAACHTDKPGAIGPSLRGVVGRKSGSVDGFHYSDAMTHANLTWDEANLRDYIANPQAKVKGNRMPYGGLANPSDLDDLIAYLKDYK